MSNNALVDCSMDFSVFVVNICDAIKGKTILTNQLLRSGTSIGANVRERKNAQSKLDFINKLSVALKEADETVYWLELLIGSEYIDQKMFVSLEKDIKEIIALITASINTARANL